MIVYYCEIDIDITHPESITHDEIYLQILSALDQKEPIAKISQLSSGQLKWHVLASNTNYDFLKSICLELFNIMGAFFNLLKRQRDQRK